MTLRGVEQASRRFPEPVAFDYLSRLERGHLMPSVPKLATLANVYRRPLQDLVDLYELEHLRVLVEPGLGDFWHYRKMGIDLDFAGDHRRSASAFLRGLEAARDSGDIDLIAQALTHVGISLNRLSRFHASRSFFEESLRCVRKDRIRGYALHNLAVAHYHLADYLIADCLSARSEAFVEEGNHDLRGNVREIHAAVAGALGRYEEGVRWSQEALEDYRKVDNPTLICRCMSNLGHRLVEAGRPEEGLTTLRESMSRAAEIGDPLLRANSALFYGRSLYRIGRYEEAISPLKAAFLIARDRGMHEQAFHSAFFLWKLSDERGFQVEGDWLAEALNHRPEVEQRSGQTEEFDAWLAEQRKKPQVPRPKDVM